MINLKILETIRKIESEIMLNPTDDEGCHSLEDEAMKLFIENCHLLSMKDIKECQLIFYKISRMDFSRWYA